MDDKPRSAVDIVMDRLRQKDAEAGTTDTPLTDQQRTAIAEVRRVYEAQVAERRIMHQSSVAGLFEPDQLAEREAEKRRDVDRFERERDEKIKRIRESGAAG